MNLVRRNRKSWDPFNALMDLERELTRSFEHPLGRSTKWAGDFDPSIEVREEGKEYKLTADLPGMKKEDFTITVEGNQIILQGERKEENTGENKGYHYSERYYGSFSRTLQFPADIDADKVTAKYKDGVLEVSLPKSGQSRQKQIDVDVK